MPPITAWESLHTIPGVSLRFAVGGELKKVGVGSGATPNASCHIGGGGGGVPPPPGKIF